MYAGRVVEVGPTAAVLERPAHPYTMGLVNAFPDLAGPTQTLAQIGGSPPDMHDPPFAAAASPRAARSRCRSA